MTRNYLKRLLTFLGLIVLSLTVSARAQEQTRLALISVSGQAEVKIAPDEAVFNIEVKNVRKDLLAAKKLNDEVVNRILALARNHRIEPQNVQTDYIMVEPEYEVEEVNGKTGRVFVGYAVSKTVVVRLRDLSRFEDLFSELLRAGVTRIRSVEFRTTELRKHKDQARAMAIRAAREKAVALAKEIGQGVGLAFSITEENTESRADNASNNSFVMSGGSSMSGSESTFAPGLISIRAQVSVSFRLN